MNATQIVHTFPVHDAKDHPHLLSDFYCWCEPEVWVMCLLCHGDEAGCFNCEGGWILYTRPQYARLHYHNDHPPVNVVHRDR